MPPRIFYQGEAPRWFYFLVQAPKIIFMRMEKAWLSNSGSPTREPLFRTGDAQCFPWKPGVCQTAVSKAIQLVSRIGEAMFCPREICPPGRRGMFFPTVFGRRRFQLIYPSSNRVTLDMRFGWAEGARLFIISTPETRHLKTYAIPPMTSPTDGIFMLGGGQQWQGQPSPLPPFWKYFDCSTSPYCV